MTGQVDEAGREAHLRGSLTYLRAELAKQDGTIAGLRTQLAAVGEKYRVESETVNRYILWADEMIAENARLAGQVAAIRALAASYEARARNGQDYVIGRITVAEDIRAALVASSPTTPTETED